MRNAITKGNVIMNTKENGLLQKRYSRYALEKLLDLHATVVSEYSYVEVYSLSRFMSTPTSQKTLNDWLNALKNRTSYLGKESIFKSLNAYYAISFIRCQKTSKLIIDNVVLIFGYDLKNEVEQKLLSENRQLILPQYYIEFLLRDLGSVRVGDKITKLTSDQHGMGYITKVDILSTLQNVVKKFCHNERKIIDNKHREDHYYRFSHRKYYLTPRQVDAVINLLADEYFKLSTFTQIKRTCVNKPKYKKSLRHLHDKCNMSTYLGIQQIKSIVVD